MDVSIATRTDVGRVRANNEDSFYVDEALGLYIVCDGMGGHNAGEVASHKACDVIRREIGNTTRLRDKFQKTGKASDAKGIRKAVEAAVQTACREIFKEASTTPGLGGMGTTCTVMLLIGHNKAVLGHVGDSRLYVLRSQQLHQLSEDHTYVNELVKRGAITKEQARNHPQSNILSRALGVQPSVAIDVMLFDFDPGDIFLLCSDGLYNYFPNPAELGKLLAAPHLQSAVDGLVQLALERGGHDNITVVAVGIDGGAAPMAATAAERRIAILKRIPIFTHLTYNELVKVLGLTQLTKIPAGTTFIQEGDAGDEFYVVLAGEVEISKGGRVLVTLAAGAHLGEMTMVDSAPRSASAHAKTDVNLLVMRREEFFGLVRSEPVIASKLLWSLSRVLSGRLRDTNDALLDAGTDATTLPDDFEIFVEDDEDDGSSLS